MFINLTHHSIRVIRDDGNIEEIPPSGKIARVEYKKILKKVDGIMIIKFAYADKVVGLPEKKEGVYYIVSSIVKNATVDREDVVAPYNILRDENKVLMCRGLRVNG